MNTVEELDAELIVAGEDNLDRKNIVLNKLMRRLANEIYQEYRLDRGPNATFQIVENRIYLSVDMADYPVLSVHQADADLPSFRWEWSLNSQTHSLPQGWIETLWAHRNRIVSMIVSEFPDIRGRLNFYQRNAPAQ
jgi:hypothetical protein